MAARKVVQFFTYKEMNLALCDDGTVWSFEEQFVKSSDGKKMEEKVIWRRRPELESPGE